MPAEAAPSFVWVEAIPGAGERIMVDEAEAHYLTKVCRVRVGEGVSLTDGRGGRAQARIVQASDEAIVEIVEVERLLPKRTAMMMVGAPERGRADWMVEKLAELGVTTFQPIDTERSHWAWAKAEVRLERWRRLARAALRQSRRSFELETREPIALSAALALAPGETGRYVADPEGTPAWRLNPLATGLSVGLVGPAEGFSTGEREQMTNAGYVGISLSDGRLRSETAALALTSWWSAAG